ETQVRFITDRTGFSAGDVSRVLVHLTPDAFGEEWDPEAQARNAGMSLEDYALAMNPLLQMSVEQAQARLSEAEAQIVGGETPELSVDELEKVRKFRTIVEKITSLSGQKADVVRTILFADSVLKNRQREILQELVKSSGERPHGSAQ